MGKCRGMIGDAHLKKFTNGRLFQNKAISKQDLQIYLLFVKGIPLKTIQKSLETQHITIDGQALFDIVRKVGLHFQDKYKKSVNTPFDSGKIIFSQFIKGEQIDSLCKTHGLNPNTLFTILRKVGLLYATYYMKNDTFQLN